jgi:hypothetical protein
LDVHGCLTARRYARRSGNLAGATGGGAVFAEMNSNATFTNCLVLNNTHFAPAKVRGAGLSRCSHSSSGCSLA